MELSMHNPGTPESGDAMAFVRVDDEDVVSRSPARLLITAPTQQSVENLARRIHRAGRRAQLPFVQTLAVELPVGPELKEYCGRLLDSAAGGSLLVSAVEDMPATVQDALIDLLAGLSPAGIPSDATRLISGTTVSLRDRVAAGTFSEQLFYRLNVIHVMVGTRSVAAVG
jgi:DNA-binding NtrC family response regulator